MAPNTESDAQLSPTRVRSIVRYVHENYQDANRIRDFLLQVAHGTEALYRHLTELGEGMLLFRRWINDAASDEEEADGHFERCYALRERVVLRLLGLRISTAFKDVLRQNKDQLQVTHSGNARPRWENLVLYLFAGLRRELLPGSPMGPEAQCVWEVQWLKLKQTSTINSAMELPGVYLLAIGVKSDERIQSKRIVYIGDTSNMRNRTRSHAEGEDNIRIWIDSFDNHPYLTIFVRWSYTSDQVTAKRHQDHCMRVFNYAWNINGNGKRSRRACMFT